MQVEYTPEMRERWIELKNTAVAIVLEGLEANGLLLQDFEQYNNTRSLVRYQFNRLLNQIMKTVGDKEVVRMRKPNAGDGI